jgi:hypothetical protein
MRMTLGVTSDVVPGHERSLWTTPSDVDNTLGEQLFDTFATRRCGMMPTPGGSAPLRRDLELHTDRPPDLLRIKTRLQRLVHRPPAKIGKHVINDQ